jgi:hypothetical protein
VRRTRRTASFLAAALGTASVAAAIAAQAPPSVSSNQRFRTSIELIAVNATVTNTEGHLVTGLPGDAFELYEDGVKQEITQFSNERVPVSLGMLLDISDSMFGRRIRGRRIGGRSTFCWSCCGRKTSSSSWRSTIGRGR